MSKGGKVLTMLSILRPFQVVVSYLFSTGSAPVRDEQFPPSQEVVIPVKAHAVLGLQPHVPSGKATAKKVAAAHLPYAQVPPPNPEVVLSLPPSACKAKD